MIATIWPGAIACAAGAVTCASTLPIATAIPSCSPVQAAASAVRPPARAPSGESGMLELVVDEAREARVQRAQVLAARVGAVLVDALVARRADVAGLLAAELPDDPVGGLDPAVDRRVDLGVLLEHLQRLGELPLRLRSARRSGRSTARRARASAVTRSACACAAWCFHSFG